MNTSASTRELCQNLLAELCLPDRFMSVVETIYWPLVKMIIDGKQDVPLIVSINGTQGAGKSTMTAFLKVIIESEQACRVASLSLDDFYKTKRERERLAIDVHSLMVTRGVPGTHDIGLLEQVLETLLSRRACRVPRFNKAVDDRMDNADWVTEEAGVEVILFEGWCNNSPVQNDDELRQPINCLEEVEDAEGIWRYYVNEQLKEYHQRIFDQTDLCIMLQIPDFACVYEWRRLQEQKLRARLPADRQEGLLDEPSLKRFIEHFERISQHTLKYLPALADVILPVSSDHFITGIINQFKR